MLCKVLRPFGGADNKTLEVGAIIDVTEWPQKNVRTLLEKRYLTEADHESVYAQAATGHSLKRVRKTETLELPAEE